MHRLLDRVLGHATYSWLFKTSRALHCSKARLFSVAALPIALLPDLMPALPGRIAAEIFFDVERPVGEPAHVALREIVPHMILIRDRLAVHLAVDIHGAGTEIAQRAGLPGGNQIVRGHLRVDQGELLPVHGL